MIRAPEKKNQRTAGRSPPSVSGTARPAQKACRPERQRFDAWSGKRPPCFPSPPTPFPFGWGVLLSPPAVGPNTTARPPGSRSARPFADLATSVFWKGGKGNTNWPLCPRPGRAGASFRLGNGRQVAPPAPCGEPKIYGRNENHKGIFERPLRDRRRFFALWRARSLTPGSALK